MKQEMPYPPWAILKGTGMWKGVSSRNTFTFRIMPCPNLLFKHPTSQWLGTGNLIRELRSAQGVAVRRQKKQSGREWHSRSLAIWICVRVYVRKTLYPTMFFLYYCHITTIINKQEDFCDQMYGGLVTTDIQQTPAVCPPRYCQIPQVGNSDPNSAPQTLIISPGYQKFWPAGWIQAGVPMTPSLGLIN